METSVDPQGPVPHLVTSRNGEVAPLAVRYALLTLMDAATVTVSATSVHEVHGVTTWRAVWLGGSALAQVTASKATPAWQGADGEGAEDADTVTAWRQPLRSLRGLSVDRVGVLDGATHRWGFAAVASFGDGHQVALPLGSGKAVHDDGEGEESLLAALRDALV